MHGKLRNCHYVWLKVKQSCYMPWRRWGERRYSSYSFTTSALHGGEWSASCRGHALPLGKGAHCTGGWVGPRAGLDTEARGKILYPCKGSNLNRLVVQSVARHYTDWATPASAYDLSFFIFLCWISWLLQTHFCSKCYVDCYLRQILNKSLNMLCENNFSLHLSICN
jgi:hypothetical protein